MSKKEFFKNSKKNMIENAKKSTTYKKILEAFSDAELIDIEKDE